MQRDDLPRLGKELPEVARAYAHWTLNPSRVRALWERMDEDTRQALIDAAKSRAEIEEARTKGRRDEGTKQRRRRKRGEGTQLLIEDAGTEARPTAAEARPTAAEPRHTTEAKRMLLRGVIDGVVLVCRYWAALLGGVDRVTNDRLQILLARIIDDAYTPAECIWAAAAYARHVEQDDWHRKQRQAGRPCTKTLENFYRDDRLALWIGKGRELATAAPRRREAAAQRTAENQGVQREQAAMTALRARFDTLPKDEQAARVEKAVALLTAQGKSTAILGTRTMANVFVRNCVLGQLQRDLAAAERAGRPIGAAIAEALG